MFNNVEKIDSVHMLFSLLYMLHDRYYAQDLHNLTEILTRNARVRQLLVEGEIEKHKLYTNNVIRQKDVRTLYDDYYEFIFDSYFNFCTSSLVHDCILQTHVMPKVCVGIVSSYLPEIITMQIFLRTYGKELHIQIGDDEYKFMCTSNMIQPLKYFESHSYLTDRKSQSIDFLEIFTHIVSNVPYNDDYDALKTVINSDRKMKFKIRDITTFLTILSCIWLTREYIFSTKTPYEEYEKLAVGYQEINHISGETTGCCIIT